VTEPGVEPTSSGCMTGDRTTDLNRSAVMSGTGIHRLIYRDIMCGSDCSQQIDTNREIEIHIRDQCIDA